MKFETILYSGKELAMIRERFPNFVKDAAMMKVPYHSNPTVLEFNINSRDAIEYIDKELCELINSGRCRREHNIEIDKKGISDFAHFRITAMQLEYTKHLYADVLRPDCWNIVDKFGVPTNCYVGAKLLSPVKLKKQRAAMLDIADLAYPCDKEIVLLVSARMKKIFEFEGITGLTYEPAQFVTAAHKLKYIEDGRIHRMLYKEISDDNTTVEVVPYIARLTHSVYREADAVFFSAMECQTHSVISIVSPLINSRISLSKIKNIDFFQVQGVQAKDNIYNYQTNIYYISRKVLELLLKHKAKGLGQQGIFIKSKFSPVVEISDD